MATPTLTSHPASRWLLLLGAASAMTLGIVGLSDLGDPLGAARARETRRETVEAERIELAWQRLLESTGDPTEPLGMAVTLAPSDWIPGGPAMAPAKPPGIRVFDILLEAALSAASVGDLKGAVEYAESALERDPGAPRQPELYLHLARWAKARGDQVGMEAQRSRLRLVASATPGRNGEGKLPALVDGTSVPLLAALIEPVDPAWAMGILTDDARPLPPALDQARFDTRGLTIDWDPWWHELESRLRTANGDLPWDSAFRHRERAALAVARALGTPLPLDEQRWTLRRKDSVILAARATDAGTRVFATSGDLLAGALRSALTGDGPRFAGSEDPFVLTFDHEPKPAGVSLAGRKWLGGTSIGYTLSREDPLASGRAEAFRMRVVRVALFALAAAVLAACVLAARSLVRARRLAHLRSTFVASVSHDLRTPIQSILLMAETLERGRVAAQASRDRYFATIRHEAQRLRRFVEDLLDGARIDRGEGARVSPETVETSAYFDEMERSMTERAQRDGAELTFVRGPMPATLELDPDGVHRAAWNLFENALRYGKLGREAPEITVEARVDDAMLRMTVEDNGPGIPASLAKTVFEPFERAASRPGSEGIQGDTGTGLGLAIVRAITRASGGDAHLAPTTRGARFEISFRAASGPGEGAA